MIELQELETEETNTEISLKKRALSDLIYKYVTAVLGSGAILIIFVILGVLLTAAYPSVIVNSLQFFTTIKWDPHLSGAVVLVNGIKTLQGASYGFLVFFVGTLVSSTIAILLGVPAGLGIAILVSQFLPKRLSAPVSFLVELLAGIPSVVFGFWGFLVLAPFLLYQVEPFLSSHLSFIPFLSGTVYSSGLLTAGIILTLMIVPIIASISRDAMVQTPLELMEGARALGLTDWEITRKIVLPHSRTTIFGSTVLGLGRALGETMAVAMVAGGAINILPKTLFYPLNTMSAFMAVQLDSAFTDPSGMFVSALMELALVLAIITIIVNVLARLIIRQGFFSASESLVRV